MSLSIIDINLKKEKDKMNKVQLGRFINRPDIGLEGNIEDIICSIKGGWEDNNIPGMEFVAKELRNMGDEHRARFVEACIGSAKEEAKGDKKNDLVYAFYRFKEQLELYFRDKETDSALTKAYCKIRYGDAYISLRKTKRHYTLEDGTDVCVVINGALDEHDKDRITFSIYEIRNHEKAYSNSGKWIYDDIKDWNGEDFDKVINELRAYAHETKLDGSD